MSPSKPSKSHPKKKAAQKAKAKPKRVTQAKLGKITPMERAEISEAQKEAGKNFLHAIRILHGMTFEPEVLARMKWPDNWRDAIDGNLADATNYLADFSATWSSKRNGNDGSCDDF